MSRLPEGVEFEGHAIVSADGMIADADGAMPAALRNDADWAAFQSALDRSALVVLGRLGHQRHPNPGRRRLVLTRSVAALGSDPADRLASLWNPEGVDLAEMLSRLGITAGTVAVTGGTGTFDLFGAHYDRFVLVEAHGLVLPGGRPTFSAGHPRTALAALGLVPDRAEMLDPAAGITSTMWRRAR